MVSIIGYGSLLSETSARETVPGLQNFRLVEVKGYKRIFNKVGVVFFSRHQADPLSIEVASCSTLEDPSSSVICSQFECSDEQYQALYEREHRFDWVNVETYESDGTCSEGLMCTSSSDQAYRFNKCQSEDEYQTRVGQYYSGLLWRDDILPYPRYLAFCLQAAEGQGEDVLNNFMDHSYLADGVTTIRSYLQRSAKLSRWREVDTGYSYRS